MKKNFEDFSQECRLQGVELDPRISVVARLGWQEATRFETGPQDPMLRAIVRAGMFRRARPDMPLAKADALIDVAVFGDDVPQRTLANMVNGSLNPVLVEAEVPYFADSSAVVNVCEQSEKRWYDALQDTDSIGDFRPLVQFVTDGGRAVAGRKGWYSQSTMSFCDAVNVGGIVYPAGSLFAATSVSDRRDRYGRAQLPAGYSSVDIARVDGMSFMRLSAFAVPEEQRAQYGLERLGQGKSMDDLRALAQTAFTACSDAQLADSFGS